MYVCVFLSQFSCKYLCIVYTCLTACAQDCGHHFEKQSGQIASSTQKKWTLKKFCKRFVMLRSKEVLEAVMTHNST